MAMFGHGNRGTPSLGRMLNKSLLMLVLTYAVVQGPIVDAKPARQESLMLGRYNSLPKEWNSDALDMRRREIDDELLEDGRRLKGSRSAGARVASEEELKQARKERNRILSGGRLGLVLAKDSGIEDGVERRRYGQSNANEGGMKRGDAYGIRKNVAQKSRYFPEEDNLEESLESLEFDSLDKFGKFRKTRMDRRKSDGVSKFYEEDDVKEHFKGMKNRAQNDDGESYGLKGSVGKKSQPLRRERTGAYDMEEEYSDTSRVASRTSDVRGVKPRARQDDDDLAPAERRELRSRAVERDPSLLDRRGDTDDNADHDDLLSEEDNGIYDRRLKYVSKDKQPFNQKKRLADNIVKSLKVTLREDRQNDTNFGRKYRTYQI